MRRKVKVQKRMSAKRKHEVAEDEEEEEERMSAKRKHEAAEEEERMSAKHKHEAAEDEEEEEGFKTDDSGDEEDGDKVAAVLTKVHVDCLDPIGMMLPYSLYDGKKVGVEFVISRLQREDNYEEEGSPKKITIPNPNAAEYVAMRVEVSLVAKPLPAKDAGHKPLRGPSRGPSFVEVFGGAARVDEVGENSCAIILPMTYANQSVDVHYILKGFHRVRNTWETVGEGDIKLVEGDVNSDKPLMLRTIIDSIYS